MSKTSHLPSNVGADQVIMVGFCALFVLAVIVVNFNMSSTPVPTVYSQSDQSNAVEPQRLAGTGEVASPTAVEHGVAKDESNVLDSEEISGAAAPVEAVDTIVASAEPKGESVRAGGRTEQTAAAIQTAAARATNRSQTEQIAVATPQASQPPVDYQFVAALERITLPDFTEADLSKQLRTDATELDLGCYPKLVAEVREVSQAIVAAQEAYEPLADWLKSRPDLAGLPLQLGGACQLDDAAVKSLMDSSRRLVPMRSHNSDHKKLDSMKAIGKRGWHAHERSGLVQILQAESTPLRMELVRLLSSFTTKNSSIALAQRAMFDLSPKVRSAAIEALTWRRREEFRAELLKGLRYVWPPVANHAAQALVELNDWEAYDDLRQLASKRHPSAPHQHANGTWAAAELVRVNHLRNCLLCHAPLVVSTMLIQRKPLPRGGVPSLSKPLSPRVYYSASGVSVRADRTYLRQDFSVAEPVADHGVWPENQRFDYFVRQQPLNENEAAKLREQQSHQDYPQKSAVLFALQKLQPHWASQRNASVAKSD